MKKRTRYKKRRCASLPTTRSNIHLHRQTPARISCVKDVQNPRCVKERILSVAEATRTATETTKGQHQRENQTDSHAVQIPVWQSENHRLAASSRHRHFATDCDPLHERDGHPFHHGKEIQGHNEFKTQPACVPQSPESELRGQSTRRSMGLRHHLCAYEGRLALSGDGDGLIFQA